MQKSHMIEQVINKRNQRVRRAIHKTQLTQRKKMVDSLIILHNFYAVSFCLEDFSCTLAEVNSQLAGKCIFAMAFAIKIFVASARIVFNILLISSHAVCYFLNFTRIGNESCIS